MKVRTGPRVLRHAVSIVLLGCIAFLFFGGIIEGALWRPFRPFLQRNSFRRSATVRLPQPASRDELHGRGQGSTLVPFGDTTPLISASLLQYYRGKYAVSCWMYFQAYRCRNGHGMRLGTKLWLKNSLRRCDGPTTAGSHSR